MKWAQLVKLGRELPEVTDGIWYRTPSLQVKKKHFVRLKEDGTSVVFLLESVDAQQFLINAMPKTYFITPHYEGWPAVLARLSKLSVKEARTRLRHAWLQKAPKKLVASLAPPRA
ncbi:MAG: MmcQ/YjbR family DNA-binding protein [Archangium sp.]